MRCSPPACRTRGKWCGHRWNGCWRGAGCSRRGRPRRPRRWAGGWRAWLDQELGAVAADPVVQSLGAVALFLLLAAAARGQLRARLDAWLYPDTADQRQILADAAAALAKVGRATGVSRIVRRTAKRGCGTPVTLLARTAAAAEARGLDDPDGDMPPLARASAIVHLLETAGGTLRVHPQDEASYFHVLLDDDRRWVVESGADAVVPVPGPGAELLGVLVAGRRLDGRLARPVDVPFLEALGASAGLALVRVLATSMAAAGSLDPPAAEECPACGCVSEAGEPAACDCGAAYVETAGPKLLAGKYRLMRRLGRGGMGAAYLARDLRLERDVAVKALTGESVFRLMGSKPEGWAMATVTHRAVAQIHGIESWRGRPFLVVEFLPRGTLADRLRRGPVPAPRALDIAALLADALAAVHEAGYLHGDVKPGNVGFASDGSPKLLDFGLAREANDATGLGGTLALPVARGAVGAGCRRGRRRLVAVRDAVRDGLGRASVRGGRRRRGAGPHSAPASRPRRSLRGIRPVGGRAHVRGVGADGSPAGAAGDRARLRRPASTRPPRAPGAGRSMSLQRLSYRDLSGVWSPGDIRDVGALSARLRGQGRRPPKPATGGDSAMRQLAVVVLLSALASSGFTVTGETPTPAPAFRAGPAVSAPPANAQLPPEIMVDRHLLRAERLLAADDPAGALQAMNEILALQEEHDLRLPDDFDFQYAQVAYEAGGRRRRSRR